MPAAAVEAAVSDAVRQGLLWLLNGPASFQGEPVPAGVLTASAQLRAPMAPLPSRPANAGFGTGGMEGWANNALALSVAFSTKTGQPVPWTVLRHAIDDAIKARWIERAADSGPWPCEMAAASTVTLKQPADRWHGWAVPAAMSLNPRVSILFSSASAVRIARFGGRSARHRQRRSRHSAPFPIQISLGEGESLTSRKVEEVNKLLGSVNPELRLKA